MAVKGGRVQRKNRSEESTRPGRYLLPDLTIDRRPADRGYRHLVTAEVLRRFLPLLPDWEGLRVGLHRIVLDAGNADCLGWHEPGVIGLCAWERQMVWRSCDAEFLRDHRSVFDRLGIDYELTGRQEVRFTESQARAFLLVHVLVHELGHHRDRMTTRSQAGPARGESFAEAYARQHEAEIVRQYWREFRE